MPIKPGQILNPAGRPIGARNKLSNEFLHALARDFAMHGADAIRRAREDDPVSYVKIVAGLQPKQVEAGKPLSELNDAELSAGIELLRAKLAGGAGGGATSPDDPAKIN